MCRCVWMHLASKPATLLWLQPYRFRRDLKLCLVLIQVPLLLLLGRSHGYFLLIIEISKFLPQKLNLTNDGAQHFSARKAASEVGHLCG